MTQDATRPDRPAGNPSPLGGADDDTFHWSEIRHFLHAPLRRPLLLLGPWFGIVALSVAGLFLLPKKYMSSTFILVESEKMPESFIPKVATGDRTERLEAVKPEILSRTRLERVLDETQPYPELDSKTRAVEKMRKSIFINVSGNDGLSIEFYHRDPHKAQQVTDRLATLFIEETIKSREQQVEGAVDFLVTQVKDAARELEMKDSSLRAYKEQHMGRLPEQLQTNLATMQMLQREAQTVEESLFFAREKQDSLARGMGRVTASAGGGAVAPAPSPDLAEMRRQLSALRTRYTEEHPDVQSLRTRIARLEARLAEVSSSDAAADADPSVAVTRGQLERANQEVKKLEERQKDLQRKITALRANVEDTPRTEQELATLTRDYQQLKENYTALLSKQLEAQMSGRLEQRWKGDRFRLLDPANLPERPVFPKPTMFLGLGAILGLLVGFGVALVAEYLDPTVKDSESLQAVQGHPVLACIPHCPSMVGTTNPARLVSLNRAAARHHEAHRRDTKLWASPGAGEVGFRDDGVVTPSKVVPIVDSLRDHSSIVGEELRLLVANLTDLCRRRKDSCIALTSALPSEGKSTVSLGLAGALARDPGRHVLLIEADLRRSTMSSTLGLPPAPGLSEWLNGTLESIPVRVVEPAGFYLITAGQTGLKRPELLGSPRMETLLRAARSHFDFVILDSVPLLPVADTILMQDFVDGFVLVARSRRTPRDAVLEALGKLRSESVVGLVLNDHREYRGSYKDHFHRRYGMAYASLPPPGMSARPALEPTATPPAASTPEPPAIVAGGTTAVASGRTASGGAWGEGPSPGRTIVPAAFHEHPARQSILTMPLSAVPVPVPVPHAEPALHGASAREARRKLVVAAVAVMVLVAALGYLAVRPRLAAMSKAPGDATHAPISAETAAALDRVRQLEERLQALEAEKAAAETRAAEDARKRVIAQAAARGRTADPAAVARAQEEARRQAQAEQETRTREEQERLRAEQRAAEERLAEQRRKDEEAPAAATTAAAAAPAAAAPAVAPPPTIPASVTPPTTLPAVAAAADPPAATTPGALVSLNDPDVIAPVLERAGQPSYPPAALLQRAEAIVQVLVLVDETGAVVDSKIAEGVNGRFGFNEAALGSMRGRRYRPATRDGLPVKVWVPVRVQFKLP